MAIGCTRYCSLFLNFRPYSTTIPTAIHVRIVIVPALNHQSQDCFTLRPLLSNMAANTRKPPPQLMMEKKDKKLLWIPTLIKRPSIAIPSAQSKALTWLSIHMARDESPNLRPVRLSWQAYTTFAMTTARRYVTIMLAAALITFLSSWPSWIAPTVVQHWRKPMPNPNPVTISRLYWKSFC